ncbi:2-oxoacid:acceptor oxidoreductase subunit alpha [Thiomicrospira sp. WB1]|uniref:2-oxoacid:acceptor oxidoreductase subunit alpha n=1 Tax=Thiomicrospira sp. WB1 TaxID=1685380 RepID=UPI000748B338|nr:2-oxoacid:acceptor oxidoreductase subunit alpha [Thiomicrospira sp. WB1]KUJ71866.1 2-oxoglutarate synthase [Thiomicrospira sp. WB1]
MTDTRPIPAPIPDSHRLSVSISGAGGAGAVTVGLILLEAFGKAGFYGALTRSFGPQIRGGESAVFLNLSDQPIETLPEATDIHLALDWKNFERFADEIPLTANTEIFYDDSREKPPALVTESGAECTPLPLLNTLKEIKGGRINMLGLGVLAKRLGLAEHAIEQALQKTLGRKGDEAVQLSRQTVEAGQALVEAPKTSPLKGWQPSEQARWHLSGNEACAIGALRGGLKLAAAYPITPATDIVEYLAPRLEKVGGQVLIAEDELAAMNMVIGGAFGGVPAMTATSGPGFALMTEAMGLAVASETPALVVTVMRGGPSTGIPTKSEQADLNQVLYGLHGDAPHVVVAPLNVSESVWVTQWALGLAEHLQTLVVLATDQHLGQSRMICDPTLPEDMSQTRGLTRLRAEPRTTGDPAYQRYALSADGLSPMSEPGLPGAQYTADGLEHTETGLPSSSAQDHRDQLAKRAQKLTEFDYGDDWATYLPADKAKHLILTWGSSFEACKEAVARHNAEAKKGKQVSLLGLRLLMPLQSKSLRQLCKGHQVTVVEQNATGQLYHYLLSEQALPKSSQSFARPGPILFTPGELQTYLRSLTEEAT